MFINMCLSYYNVEYYLFNNYGLFYSVIYVKYNIKRKTGANTFINLYKYIVPFFELNC